MYPVDAFINFVMINKNLKLFNCPLWVSELNDWD